MKKIMICILFVLFGTSVSLAQDTNKGMEAFQIGDYATAMKEFQSLAELGDADAQNKLGIMYEYGLGVVKDATNAAKWYLLAAEHGNASTQYKLGLMYNEGTGVLQDYAKALKWYQLSADQGNKTAQALLGLMYEEGNGVLKDNVTAHMWYNIASANGHESAGGHRDKVAAFMTASGIEKATAMAAECMKSDYKKCGY